MWHSTTRHRFCIWVDRLRSAIRRLVWRESAQRVLSRPGKGAWSIGSAGQKAAEFGQPKICHKKDTQLRCVFFMAAPRGRVQNFRVYRECRSLPYLIVVYV